MSALAGSVPDRGSSVNDVLGWKDCGLSGDRKKARKAAGGEDPTDDPSQLCGLARAGPVEPGPPTLLLG